MKIFFSCCIVSLLVVSCASYKSIDEVRFSQATIHRNIKEGMSTSEVVRSMGSPNIITRDKNGEISWVYDSIKTVYSNKNDLTLFELNGKEFIIASAASLAYLGYQGLKAASVSTGNTLAGSIFLFTTAALGLNDKVYSKEKVVEKKTLTLVLDFDRNELLKNFSYHYTSF